MLSHVMHSSRLGCLYDPSGHGTQAPVSSCICSSIQSLHVPVWELNFVNGSVHSVHNVVVQPGPSKPGMHNVFVV